MGPCDGRHRSSELATHARTLGRRFDDHREVILRFTTDLAIPFTNNQSYLSTAGKWGIGRYDALKCLFTTGA